MENFWLFRKDRVDRRGFLSPPFPHRKCQVMQETSAVLRGPHFGEFHSGYSKQLDASMTAKQQPTLSNWPVVTTVPSELTGTSFVLASDVYCR